ncbi:MAG: MFS transporter [Clostridia bacterium]|nr:MFS transporter [Clostridia bacterium]
MAETNLEKLANRTAENTDKRYVGVKETLIYGIANGGQCLGYNMVRAQLTFFLVTVFGVPAKAVSLMILLMGFWDAFNDPLMGAIVDKTRTRYGKLRPYLIFVPIFLGIATVVFFGGAEFLKNVESTTVKIVYMCVTYFVWEFFYTIGDIPFWGLSAAISPSPVDRSRVIKSARLISGIIGGIPGIMITVCIDLSKNGIIPFSLSQVFMFLGIFAGTVGMFLFSLAGTMTKERVVQSSDEPKLLDCFRYLFRNKPLLLIVLSSILATLGGIGGTFTTYYYTLSLGIASLSLLAGLPGTIMNFIGFGTLSKLEKRFTSKQIIYMGVFANAATAIVVFLLGAKFYTNAKVIVPLLAFQGMINGYITSINAVIPTKMIAETVDYMEWKTGDRGEGMSFSLLTFISKLTGSLSSALATAIIPLVGLQEMGQDMVLNEASGINTRFWLWALITAIPAVLSFIQLIPYKFYDLEGEKLATIQREIKERREENTRKVTGE